MRLSPFVLILSMILYAKFYVGCAGPYPGGRGGGGVQLNPPSKLMIFMTIVMPLKIEGRNVRTV